MIRVLLADDQALVRGGFRSLLDAEDDLEVVGEAIDGRQAAFLFALPQVAIFQDYITIYGTNTTPSHRWP